MYIIWYDVVNNNHLGLQLIFTSAYVINENEWIESTETQVGSASSAVTQNSSVPEMEWRPEVQLDSRRTTDYGLEQIHFLLCYAKGLQIGDGHLSRSSVRSMGALRTTAKFAKSPPA